MSVLEMKTGMLLAGLSLIHLGLHVLRATWVAGPRAKRNTAEAAWNTIAALNQYQSPKQCFLVFLA